MSVGEVLAGLLILLGLMALPFAGYLGLLTLFSQRQPRRQASRVYRFALVVPAHNEAGHIGATLTNLAKLDYAAAQVQILVVADNCTDNTAVEVEACGVRVLRRQDEVRRGKGYALDHAFNVILKEAWAEAVVVIDADTVVAPALLAAFAMQLEAGARAVQGDYTVRNPEASWRTRLMLVALSMFHRLRSLARERLGVSVGLRGNGMCFLVETLQQVPHRAAGLVEDVEYGIALGHAGIRVAYADAATVYGEMVAGGRDSESQRQRWEGGRAQLLRQELPDLLRAAWRGKSGLLLDLAFDLMVPPLSYVALILLVGSSSAGLLVWLQGLTPSTLVALALWGAQLLCLLAYVLRGAALSDQGLRAYAVLAWAPLYVAWKILLAVRGRMRRGSTAWVRTAREPERKKDL